MFISLEGLDGSGKTTQFDRLAAALRERGYDVLALREPGGTTIGERVRDILHDHTHAEMDSRTELLLYCASRAQLMAQRIQPHLQQGGRRGIVVCDRFADSTLAYQGYGRGLELNLLRSLLYFATHGVKPNLTLYFDVPVDVGLARRSKSTAKGEEFNRMDAQSIEFYRRVEAGYRELILAEPERWCVVDATQPIEVVTERMLQIIAAKL
ncbi:MAG: dTMP kinase [Anaerolineae bacterium]|nr:dTMP kinase [Anaerolineae bacterium]